MSKKTEFINYVEALIDATSADPIEMTDNALAFWNALKGGKDEEKPTFTDNGKMVMKYLQSLPTDSPMLKAKDIAEGMLVSSRAVSGAMRKLCSDGFVEKIGQDPVMYSLTDAGRQVIIED